MLPHKHFFVAGLIIAPAAVILLPAKSILEAGKWVLVGGLLSAAIDLDVYAIVLLKSKKEARLKPFRNLLETYRKFSHFMDVITETGILKIGMKTHLISSVTLILVFYFSWNSYFIPVTLGVVSHILSDMPNILRIVRVGDKYE